MKNIIKAVCLGLCAVILCACFAGCGGAKDNSSVKAKDVFDDLTSQVTFPEMLSLDADLILAYLGVKADTYEEAEVHIPLTAVSGEMVIIFKSSGENLENIKKSLESYHANISAQMNNYIPEEYAKLSATSVKSSGSFVWVVVSADQAKADEIVNGYLN